MKRFVCMILGVVMMFSATAALADTFTFFTPTTAPTTAPTVSVTMPPFTSVVTKGIVEMTGDVYVRSGPARGFTSLGVAKKGTELTYANQNAFDERGVEWFKVEYNGGFGWVSSKYSVLTPGTEIVVPELYVRATASVNLRAGAGISYADIGTLARGEQVKYTGNSKLDASGNTWYEVEYYDFGYGWVCGIYAELVYATYAGVAETESTVVGSYVEATNGNSNLRSGPGLDYEDLGTLKEGSSATYMGAYAIDERGVMWYYVKMNDQLGWISSRYATLK